ncbi:MAG: phosphoglycolate phosphatase [Blastocatellia bacterium]
MAFFCYLFDLDGTLIDSKADIIESVNLSLDELGLARLPAGSVQGFIGEGVRLLISRAVAASFARPATDGEIEQALVIYARHYHAHLLDQTRLYPGVIETLESLRPAPMAVVTNKPVQFTIPILDGLGLTPYFAAVLGGDSLPERKPAPAPLIEAARLCEQPPAACLMIGDSAGDIIAGRAAGMRTCGCTYGFRDEAELVSAGADFLIGDMMNLPALLKRG